MCVRQWPFLPPNLGGRGGLFFILLFCALSGCAPHSPDEVTHEQVPQKDVLAPGVVHRSIPYGADGAGIDLIDVDLRAAHVQLRVATDGLRSAHGRTFGNTFTPAEWLGKTHAQAAVNGGYFGETDGEFRSEVMGLLVQNGKVVHGASVPHAALLLDAKGRAQIAWASSRRGAVVLSDAPSPFRKREGRKNIFFPLSRSDEGGPHVQARGAGSRVGEGATFSAVGCGPMLVWNGKVRVTDTEERLASLGAQARTFVATDAAGQHVVFGMASAAEYTHLAAFLVGYFPCYDHTRAGRAFCLDGGSSSQLTYQLPDGTGRSPRQTGVAVPDALVLLPR